jgi:PEP-CTERM motif-containing protein
MPFAKNLRPFDALAAVLIVMSFVAPSASAATNLVQNPGFETGDFTDWSPGPGWFVCGPPSCSGTGYVVYEGAYYAYVEANLLPTSLSQTLSTVSGDKYTLSFAFNPGIFMNGPPGEKMQVYWNGQLVKDVDTDVVDTNWTVYSIGGLEAQSTSTTLEFYMAFANDAYPGVDAVSVTVPEPSTWAMIVAGFAALGFAGYRSSRKTATIAA